MDDSSENLYDGLAQKINTVSNILLTTHKSCDADGFGSEMALYYALRKAGKKVQVVHYEEVHPRYKFLNPDNIVQVFGKSDLISPELILAFDTNDQRLIEPLYKAYKDQCKVLFLDHHQVLKSGPAPTSGSIIDVNSASTGEMAYKLIQSLGIDLDEKIAYSLYTSIAFDTHIFKFIRSSRSSYEIATHLLSYNIDSTKIHRMLFANAPMTKVKFLAHALGQVEFKHNNTTAFCHVSYKDMERLNAGVEETHDVIDQIMSVGSCKLAIFVREVGPNEYRISFRSRDDVKVLAIAESLGGGGHSFASGVSVNEEDFQALKKNLLEQAQELVSEL